MQARNYPTQAELMTKYSMLDGKLCRKSDGTPAAFLHKGSGRRVIKHEGRNLYLSRLMWIFTHGDIPESMCVDHVNRDKTDDRIDNLRLISKADNCRNVKKKANTSGFRGVSWHKTKLAWAASATNATGYKAWLGTHDTKESAFKAVSEFLNKEFPYLNLLA